MMSKDQIDFSLDYASALALSVDREVGLMKALGGIHVGCYVLFGRAGTAKSIPIPSSCGGLELLDVMRPALGSRSVDNDDVPRAPMSLSSCVLACSREQPSSTSSILVRDDIGFAVYAGAPRHRAVCVENHG